MKKLKEPILNRESSGNAPAGYVPGLYKQHEKYTEKLK